MIDPLYIAVFLVLGFATGILAGMLGIGGGAVFVPALYMLLPHFYTHTSQIPYIVIGTTLFTASVATFSSALNHLKAGNSDKKRAGLFLAGSVVSSVASTFLVVQTKPVVLQWIFAVLFILVAAKMFFDKSGSKAETKRSLNAKPDDLFLIGFGLLTGVVVAFGGLGGGIIAVPVMFYIYKLEFKRAIGTSALITSGTTLATAIAYLSQPAAGPQVPFQVGYVYLIAGIPMGLGSVAGAYLGVKFVLKTKGAVIKKIFSILILIVVFKIIIGLLR